MICKICKNIYPQETSFVTLFAFDNICPSCQKINQIPYSMESIPLDRGTLDYIILFSEAFIPENQEIMYMQKYEKPLKLAIYGMKRYDIILYVDSIESNDFSYWFPLIKDFGNLLFLCFRNQALF